MRPGYPTDPGDAGEGGEQPRQRQGTSALPDARRDRYTGLPKIRREHIPLATAINLIRLDAWWTSTPLGTTRTSHYARLELDLAI